MDVTTHLSRNRTEGTAIPSAHLRVVHADLNFSPAADARLDLARMLQEMRGRQMERVGHLGRLPDLIAAQAALLDHGDKDGGARVPHAAAHLRDMRADGRNGVGRLAATCVHPLGEIGRRHGLRMGGLQNLKDAAVHGRDRAELGSAGAEPRANRDATLTSPAENDADGIFRGPRDALGDFGGPDALLSGNSDGKVVVEFTGSATMKGGARHRMGIAAARGADAGRGRAGGSTRQLLSVHQDTAQRMRDQSRRLGTIENRIPRSSGLK